MLINVLCSIFFRLLLKYACCVVATSPSWNVDKPSTHRLSIFMERYSTIAFINEHIPAGSLLTATQFAGYRLYKDGRRKIVLCQCKCGNLHIAVLKTIIDGSCKSCGCLKPFAPALKHGGYLHPLYSVWCSMKDRCKNNPRYYKKGIKVCDEWINNFQAFFTWGIAHGYEKGLQLDRKRNNGNYEPSNCRFVTRSINLNNRDVSIYITLNGVRKTLLQWSRDLKIPAPTLYSRVKLKWKAEKILSKINYRATPKNQKHNV